MQQLIPSESNYQVEADADPVLEAPQVEQGRV